MIEYHSNPVCSGVFSHIQCWFCCQLTVSLVKFDAVCSGSLWCLIKSNVVCTPRLVRFRVLLLNRGGGLW